MEKSCWWWCEWQVYFFYVDALILGCFSYLFTCRHCFITKKKILSKRFILWFQASISISFASVGCFGCTFMQWGVCSKWTDFWCPPQFLHLKAQSFSVIHVVFCLLMPWWFTNNISHDVSNKYSFNKRLSFFMHTTYTLNIHIYFKAMQMLHLCIKAVLLL